MCRSLVAVSLFLTTACGSSGRQDEPLRTPSEVLPGARGAPIEILTSDDLLEIARLEDARSLGEGRLFQQLRANEDPRVRARAATALGHFPHPLFGNEVTLALVRALEDPELSVRIAAAFALGERADPASAGTLLAYRNDPEPRLRARLVEAVSKIDVPSVPAQVLLSLRDSDLEVRMEAALGTARWDRAATNAGDVNRALLDTLRPYRITTGSVPKTAIEAELVWRILWALGRRKAELGRGPFLEYAGAGVPLERLFAIRGLAQLQPDAASIGAILAALVGPTASGDWRCAYEATVALGNFARADRSPLDADTLALLESEALLDALEKATEYGSVHVRAGAIDALGHFGNKRRVLELLQRGRVDLSIGVRAATLRSRVRISSPDDGIAELLRGAKDEDPVIRATTAEVAGGVEDARAGKILLTLTQDPALFVAIRAVEQLGKHPSDEVRAELHRFLAQEDNGLRLAAVQALESMPSPADVGPLSQALSSAGDGGAEVAFNALEALAAIGTNEARYAIERSQSDLRPYVRTVARRLVRESFGFEPGGEDTPFEPGRGVPVAGKDYPLWRFNPMVEISTSRGSLVFELFPNEAPIHVHSFLKLVEQKAYDGLTFHRVVPDFVVQGGDYRGDGNGARPWEGEALRAEFTQRKYTRGSLGMPRNEDPDSGGSQFFVTHVPTPHLDGRYTIFGELRTGGDVLDQLEVGDRIQGVRVLR